MIEQKRAKKIQEILSAVQPEGKEIGLVLCGLTVNGIFIFYQRAMKQKHNWEELKNKYLVSPIMEVAEFIRQELGTNKGVSGNTAKQTKGRREDKEIFRKEIIKEAQERAKEEFIEIYKPDLKDLGDMHKTVINLARLKLNIMGGNKENPKDIKDVDMKDLEKLREMILTEMGKPTKILKEEGKKSIEINTQLTEEEKKDIESLLGKG